MYRSKTRQPNIEKICKGCGKTYIGYRGQKYCSRECGIKANKKRIMNVWGKMPSGEPEYKSVLEVDPKDGKLKWRKVKNV